MSDFPYAGPEPRLLTREPWSVELDQVSATVQALQSAATLLQGAMQQRQGMWSELQQLQQQRASSEQALGNANAQLEQVRSEQAGVVAEFDRLVQAALNRRSALLAEISELEQRRNAIAHFDTAQSRTMVEPKSIVAEAPFQPIFVPSSVVVATPAPAPMAPEPIAIQAPVVEPIASPIAPAAVAPAPSPAKRGRLFGLRVAFNILIGAGLAGLAVLLTPVTQLAGGMQLLAVMSGSMEPVIQVGGIVAVRPVAVSELQVGDVITFANQGNPDVLITHRIVSLDARGGQTVITTKGDANDSVDALTVPINRAVGRVDFTLPWLGYAMMWLASPMAKVGILAVALIGFALPTTRRGSRETSKTAPVAAAEPATPVAPANPTYAALEREIEGLLPRAA